MTLMPLLFGCFSRMFSGFRSQCTICCLRKNRSAVRIWMAKRRISPSDTPWKLLFLINSYRLMESSEKVMHRWCRK